MVEITAQMVAALRAKTGAGLIDCKKALAESNGNEEEAVVILKKKGIASAAKKAGRSAQEGLIASYIHNGGKLGVLVEVNCETDFVARNDEFKQMVSDISMHIAAASPLYLKREDVPQALIDKETEIAKAQCVGIFRRKRLVLRKKRINRRFPALVAQNCKCSGCVFGCTQSYKCIYICIADKIAQKVYARASAAFKIIRKNYRSYNTAVLFKPEIAVKIIDAVSDKFRRVIVICKKNCRNSVGIYVYSIFSASHLHFWCLLNRGKIFCFFCT